MRNALMAMAALSLAIPVSMAVPTDGAQARKHYRYKEWRGRDGAPIAASPTARPA